MAGHRKAKAELEAQLKRTKEVFLFITQLCRNSKSLMSCTTKYRLPPILPPVLDSKKISRSNLSRQLGMRLITKQKRLREKIRSWIGNSEYKERETSLEAVRRKIEEYMELYKSWEKEAKMKAFSKEGLASAKVDKKAEEKIKTSSWLNEGLQTLNDMKNVCEAEIEHRGAYSKRSKRGKADHRIEFYKAKLEDIKLQSKRVELMLRSLENEAISAETLNDVRDAFESYLQDPDNDYARSNWEAVIGGQDTTIEI
eukprot:TRINITY_DN134998_c1_g1_i1.p1 TRINITY_DN134998_c1_g1~~TRINITY_DN134998_c1_g1_i1.p1  ORF type:complete len:294 (+),score=22.90 TRINITY_DN134998_c1_g1_i1:119-883(+)